MCVVIIVIALSEGQQRDHPAIPTRIGDGVRLIAPQMADGIDAECGVQDEEGPAQTGQEKASQSADPSAIERPDRQRNGQTGQNDQHVIAMLPHDQWIFPELKRVLLVGM